MVFHGTVKNHNSATFPSREERNQPRSIGKIWMVATMETIKVPVSFSFYFAIFHIPFVLPLFSFCLFTVAILKNVMGETTDGKTDKDDINTTPSKLISPSITWWHKEIPPLFPMVCCKAVSLVPECHRLSLVSGFSSVFNAESRHCPLPDLAGFIDGGKSLKRGSLVGFEIQLRLPLDTTWIRNVLIQCSSLYTPSEPHPSVRALPQVLCRKKTS